ncbi:MAG: hypothetical protein QXH57_03935 [Sulfolobales archaeon]
MKKSIVAAVIVMGFLVALFFFGGLGGIPTKQDGKVLASQEVSLEGGTVSISDKSFTVLIPRGALQSKEKIEIVEPSYLPQTKVGKIVVAYEVLSKVESLNTPAVIKFKIPNATNTLNKSLEDMYTVMYYDEVNRVYVELPCEYDSVEREISVSTHHFSLWALISLENYTVAHSPNFKIMSTQTLMPLV